MPRDNHRFQTSSFNVDPDKPTVAIAHIPENNEVIVAHSDLNGAVLFFSTEGWRTFVEGVKAGEFDF